MRDQIINAHAAEHGIARKPYDVADGVGSTYEGYSTIASRSGSGMVYVYWRADCGSSPGECIGTYDLRA